MDDISVPDRQGADDQAAPQTQTAVDYAREIGELRSAYEARLISALMKTEAIRAGMLDLDGLKLADLSSVSLGPDDRLLGGQEVMDALRRAKPWLFGASTSSSSSAAAPSAQPPRPKSALEMTDSEYAAARAALVSRRL